MAFICLSVGAAGGGLDRECAVDESCLDYKPSMPSLTRAGPTRVASTVDYSSVKCQVYLFNSFL